MSDSSNLDALEQEVEQARARLAGDLARLRDPKTFSNAKDELSFQFGAYKDEAIERARDSLARAARTLLEEVRGRVEANPTAALVLAAGLAWRLARRPPIAGLLMTAGAASLVATRRPDVGSPTPTTDALAAARDVAVTRAHRAASAVQQTTLQVRGQILEGAAAASVQASAAAAATAQLVDDATQAGARLSAEAATRASDSATRGARLARDRFRENPLLFGAVALIVGAAVGLAARERSERRSD